MKQFDKGKLLVLLGSALIMVLMSNMLFPRTPHVRIFNFITESLNVLLLAYFYLAISQLKERSYYLYFSSGLYLAFIALSADALDQFYLHSELYTAVFEKGFELVAYILIFIGVRQWFRDYQRLNKQLSRQAITDNLTGIYNRRGITNQLRVIQQECDNKASIILIDFNDFKHVNDRYGHHIGDVVLQKVSQYFSAIKSDKHIPGRWGGEEFVIVAKQHTAEDAAELCIMIQSLLEQVDLSEHIGQTKITLSYGISEMRSGEHYEECIKRADLALYQSKNNGKNCINIV